MLKYFLRRVGLGAAMLVVVTFLTNAMLLLLPGDPAKVKLGFNWTPEAGAEYLKQVGLDKPLLVRYPKWAFNALQGDFGISYYDLSPVKDRIFRAFPLSFQLVILALTMSLLISVPLGVLSAYKSRTRTDRIITSVSFGALAVPGFVVAILLLFIGGKLQTGEPGNVKSLFLVDYKPLSENPLQTLRSLFLPALTIAFGQSANFLRLIRTDMATTLQEDFVLMAKSKGLSDKYILFRHAFRPSSFTLLTIGGIQIGQAMGTAVIIESVFGLNGLGAEVLRSILQRDYATTVAAVAVLTTVFVVIATMVDLAYGVIDPRVRSARKLG
jgi:peptide/nickel transport system permease protein